MLEFSPYTLSKPETVIDFELRLTIDECPVRIWPERTRFSIAVRWECGHCSHNGSIPAANSWSQEALVSAGKLMACRHIAEAHPGPTLQTLFEPR